MKISKPQSRTTDTQSSPTNLLSSQLLSKTNMSSLSYENENILKLFSHTQNKQILFLRTKNQQLQQKIKRMSQQIKQLQNNKVNLLKINQNYVKVINQYYHNLNVDFRLLANLDKNQSEINQNSISQISKTQSLNKRCKSQNHKRNKSIQKADSQINKIHTNSHRLQQLQKDHRNLSRHCLVMEQQIKNYLIEMQKFNKMKLQLKSVNHTSPSQLIKQLYQTVQQNKTLKKQNNRLSFELQKVKSQTIKLSKTKQTQKKLIHTGNQQIQKNKALINKTVQQSKDKANQYQQKINELELKVSKLENQLRKDQQALMNNQQKRKSIQISRVQDALQNNFLKTSLTDLLNPKKHIIFSVNRNLVKQTKIQLQRKTRNSSSLSHKSSSLNKNSTLYS